MRRVPALAQAVTRLHVASTLALALLVLLVGPSFAGVALVARDDADAIALARTLGSELTEHIADSRAQQAVLVGQERDEQRWFGRVLGVWRDGQAVGAPGAEASLEPWSDAAEGCRTARPTTAWMRVCTVAVTPWQLVVATPVVPVLTSLSPLVIVLAVLAVLATLGVAAASNGLIRRQLAPLSALDATLAAFTPEPDRRIPSSWGAAEIDELATTFNDLLVRVDEALARERRFVANAAHELRTPLTRLWGAIDLAAQQTEGDAAARLGAASRSCRELADTLEALLALSRDVLDCEEVVEVHDVVVDALSRLAPEARPRVTHHSAADTAVRGDALLLRLALANLLDNALKYTAGEVSVSLGTDGSWVSVQVADEGAGLSAQELSSLLEPFVRGASAGGTRGTGLGLALARHVAELHGGTLTLESRAGRGLTVTVSLPPWRPAQRPRVPGRPSHAAE